MSKRSGYTSGEGGGIPAHTVWLHELGPKAHGATACQGVLPELSPTVGVRVPGAGVGRNGGGVLWDAPRHV